MDKIGAYGAYKNMYENTIKNGNVNKDASADKAVAVSKNENVAKPQQVNLSEKAKNLLKELQKKYGNMDFMIANYETDEEAAEIMSRGTKEFSVLIEPEVLEEMAADESVKEKYIGILEDSMKQLDSVKEQLGDDAKDVKRIGITVGEDGSVKFFAELEKASEKQRERIEKNKEAKAEEAKAEEAKAEKAEKAAEKPETLAEQKKKAYVQAETIEELVEKIKEINWDKIQKEEVAYTGSKIDFTI